MSTHCFHCGDQIKSSPIINDSHSFCCSGCSTIYTLLKTHDLNSFYTLESGAGTKPKTAYTGQFDFLEIDSLRNKFIEFEDENSFRTTLFLPQIHCSSCIYLLEQIKRIEPGVVSCQVNFIKREASFVANKALLSLKDLAILLNKIGYAPNFGERKNQTKQHDKLYLYKLGVAGFAFGSIMLWSFPEYLGISTDNPEFRSFTAYLSLLISIPVLLYSASEYLISAFKSIRYKKLNLDVPISIGIIALYFKSAWTILIGAGPGYMDSFAGFIFFLLIGKWFQSKTYRSLSFERDYTSYFPVAVTRVSSGREEIIPIENIAIGDQFTVRNEEIIACDSVLLSKDAKIDYSFVTGESEPVSKRAGDHIFAGGKLIGPTVKLEAVKLSNRSHLTQLWNEHSSESSEASGFLVQTRLSYYFLIGLLIISAVSGIAWFFIDYHKISDVIVAILIVACPCALALSAPFTFGNIMRLLGRKGLYLKNTHVIEQLNSVTDIVFDKTGTLTTGKPEDISYQGQALEGLDLNVLISLVNSSTHPISRATSEYLKNKQVKPHATLINFEEIKGKGIQASHANNVYRFGSATFCDIKEESHPGSTYFTKNNDLVGYFHFEHAFRPGIAEMIRSLSRYKLHILSGDNKKDEQRLKELFPSTTRLNFNQTPQEKAGYIKNLEQNGAHVLMIGDGLNDSGALAASTCGIAVSEDLFRFTPASKAILLAEKLDSLPTLLAAANYSKIVLAICLTFSLGYNVIGLSYAISGQLTPLVAAILMPISSITVVLITTVLVLSKARSSKN